MLDKSLFVSDEIHEREVELADGSKHLMYFKELPGVTFRRFALDNESENEAQRIDSMARLISQGLVTKDGKPAITFEQAKKLKPAPMVAIFTAIQEVNSTRPKEIENGDSGTS